ncbi:MAG: hypothetical protein BWZ10_02066 [candidate division BRC1 bacterium ADurb.BinA364]|nr:MAG: hypothetical protein BWZ10_02066 [candidate division BRC1 bacterium ADurb.BinA364]
MVASKRNRVLAGMMLAIGFAALRSAPAAEVAAVLRAPDFKLSDQYGQSLSIQYPRESACVLIFADQRGSSQVEGWVRPLYSRYQGRVTISGVAELSSVPSALRTMIQGIFKKTIQFPVMLDWTGRVSRQHEYRGKAAAVVIVDPQGLILHRETGKAAVEALERCYEVLDGLVRTEDETPPTAPQDGPAVEQAQRQSRQNGAGGAVRQSDQAKK